jgi:flavodoxin I
MAKVLIVYGSETGNTKAAADMIAETLMAAGHTVTVRDVLDTTIAALSEPFDLYLLGVSTWGAVVDEVTEDYKSFHEAMKTADLTGRKLAVFGCGDKGYENFCKAVDYAAERARSRGATLVAERLKIDLDPRKSADVIRAWAQNLTGMLA